jgi:hypothetical protein
MGGLVLLLETWFIASIGGIFFNIIFLKREKERKEK